MPSMKVMPSVEIRSRLDHVAFVDVVALVQDDRDAVADRSRIARQLGDVADHLGHGGTPASLRILGISGQRIDDVAGEVGAIGRRQRRPLLALEIVMQDEFAVLGGQDEIDARPLEIAVEEQMGIRNNNGVRGRMRRNAAGLEISKGL